MSLLSTSCWMPSLWTGGTRLSHGLRTWALGCLVVGLFAAAALPAAGKLTPAPAMLKVEHTGPDQVLLSWLTVSVITNADRTPIYPAYIVEVSEDLRYWRETKVRIPQRVGGPSLLVSTNLTGMPVLPVVFIRVRSELNLSGADLSNGDFRGVNFQNENLSGTRFDSSLLGGADLSAVLATRAVFNNARAPGLKAAGGNFTDSRWDRADLSTSLLDGAVFQRALLAGANLQRIQAWRTVFAQANMNAVNLGHAVCDEADFSEVEFPDAQLGRASFRHARMTSVDFDETDGEEADFYGAILRESVFRDSDFSDADFRHVDLQDSDLEWTDFRWADFRGADMDDVDSFGCSFSGARF
ncbi:MAG: pentapeptide repeat-containing protein [Verrucomicrobiales bacterium]|nr:pentapeptide repeat-containing protein [Verrucomicrobiales bacterium]